VLTSNCCKPYSPSSASKHEKPNIHDDDHDHLPLICLPLLTLRHQRRLCSWSHQVSEVKAAVSWVTMTVDSHSIDTATTKLHWTCIYFHSGGRQSFVCDDSGDEPRVVDQISRGRRRVWVFPVISDDYNNFVCYLYRKLIWQALLTIQLKICYTMNASARGLYCQLRERFVWRKKSGRTFQNSSVIVKGILHIEGGNKDYLIPWFGSICECSHLCFLLNGAFHVFVLC